jgi:hypothetical protein
VIKSMADSVVEDPQESRRGDNLNRSVAGQLGVEDRARPARAHHTGPREADRHRERRARRQPKDNRAFCEAKGRLYFLIKDIINAARALHSKEPEGQPSTI